MPLTKEQLELRKHTLGASEIAAVAGLNPWKTAHDVWLDKMGYVESESTLTTRAGDLAESAIRQQYIEETGAELEQPGTLIHPRHSWMSATPDFKVKGIKRVGEIKFVGWRLALHWGTEPDDVPDYYRPQAEWQMEVCGVEKCDFAVWIGGPDFRIYRVKRDPQLASLLGIIGSRFWDEHVVKKVPPTVDASESARKMLARLFPVHNANVRLATPEVERLGDELIAAKLDVQRAEAVQAGLENRLREAIGDAEGVRAKSWKATWKANKNGVRSLLFKEKGRAA